MFEQLHQARLHKQYKSHDVVIVRFNGQLIKMTYEAYNAVERFEGQMWSQGEWKHIFGIHDLGEWPQSDAYNLLSDTERKKRTDDLIKKGKTFINQLNLSI